MTPLPLTTIIEAAIPIAAIVFGLLQAAKETGIESKTVKVVLALLLAVVLSLCWWAVSSPRTWALGYLAGVTGIVSALMAMGLWEGAKRVGK